MYNCINASTIRESSLKYSANNRSSFIGARISIEPSSRFSILKILEFQGRSVARRERSEDETKNAVWIQTFRAVGGWRQMHREGKGSTLLITVWKRLIDSLGQDTVPARLQQVETRRPPPPGEILRFEENLMEKRAKLTASIASTGSGENIFEIFGYSKYW